MLIVFLTPDFDKNSDFRFAVIERLHVYNQNLNVFLKSLILSI